MSQSKVSVYQVNGPLPVNAGNRASILLTLQNKILNRKSPFIIAVGPNGSGKTHFARLFARKMSILDEQQLIESIHTENEVTTNIDIWNSLNKEFIRSEIRWLVAINSIRYDAYITSDYDNAIYLATTLGALLLRVELKQTTLETRRALTNTVLLDNNSWDKVNGIKRTYVSLPPSVDISAWIRKRQGLYEGCKIWNESDALTGVVEKERESRLSDWLKGEKDGAIIVGHRPLGDAYYIETMKPKDLDTQWSINPITVTSIDDMFRTVVDKASDDHRYKNVKAGIRISDWSEVYDYVHTKSDQVCGDGYGFQNRRPTASSGSMIRSEIMQWASLKDGVVLIMIGSEAESVVNNIRIPSSLCIHTNVVKPKKFDLQNVQPQIQREWSTSHLADPLNLNVAYAVGCDYIHNELNSNVKLNITDDVTRLAYIGPYTNWEKVSLDPKLRFAILAIPRTCQDVLSFPVNTEFYPGPSSKHEYLYAYINMYDEYLNKSLQTPKLFNLKLINQTIGGLNDQQVSQMHSMIAYTAIVKINGIDKLPTWGVHVALFSLSNTTNPIPSVTINNLVKKKVWFIVNYPISGYERYMLSDIKVTINGDKVTRQLNSGPVTDHTVPGYSLYPHCRFFDVFRLIYNLRLDAGSLYMASASNGSSADEYTREWGYYTNIFSTIKDVPEQIPFQLKRYNQTAMIKAYTEVIRAQLCIKQTDLHAFRRLAVIHSDGVPITHHRVAGYYPKGSERLHIKPGDYVAPSGHMLNMILMSLFTAVDFHNWFGVIKGNVSQLDSQDAKYNRDLFEKGELDEIPLDRKRKKFHSYADWILGLESAKLLCNELGIPLSTTFISDVVAFFDQLLKDFPVLSKMGYQSTEYAKEVLALQGVKQ